MRSSVVFVSVAALLLISVPAQAEKMPDGSGCSADNDCKSGRCLPETREECDKGCEGLPKEPKNECEWVCNYDHNKGDGSGNVCRGKLSIGAECKEDKDCKSGNCFVYSMTCQEAHTNNLKIGDRCYTSETTEFCKKGLYCDTTGAPEDRWDEGVCRKEGTSAPKKATKPELVSKPEIAAKPAKPETAKKPLKASKKPSKSAKPAGLVKNPNKGKKGGKKACVKKCQKKCKGKPKPKKCVTKCKKKCG